MSASCVFCAIVAGAEAAQVLMQSDRAVAFLDINPAGEGHTLVIPRRHVTDIWELEGEDADDVWRLTISVAHRLREVLHPDGLTLFQANGAPILGGVQRSGPFARRWDVTDQRGTA